jgi:hypothetical protein
MNQRSCFFNEGVGFRDGRTHLGQQRTTVFARVAEHLTAARHLSARPAGKGPADNLGLTTVNLSDGLFL